jgi:hypothetical protein
MIARLAAAALLPVCALAQLQTFVIERGAERPLGATYDVGSTTPGDAMETNFRVRNRGTAAASLQTISVSGTGFSLGNYPPLPYTVAPGATTDFTVRFRPSGVGTFNGTVSVNGVATALNGTSVLAAELQVENALSLVVLDAGATVDFGRIERDTAVNRRFHLVNRTAGWLRIAAVRVEGAAYSGPLGVAAPLMLDGGQRVAFEVRFAPASAGLAQGALEVDGRRVILKGTGTEVPLPRPVVRTDTGPFASAQQSRLSIEFAEPARIAGTGELRVEFRSAVPSVTADPAVLFMPVSSRFAPFTVRVGDTRARFGDREDIIFQTGTTAGSLVFTARLGDYSEQTIIPIVPAAVEFESVKALRSGSQIEVQIVGYDNLRTVSQMIFAFYGSRDAVISRLPIDVSADFRRYFETTTAGGAFALRAVFPVLGNPSDVVSVEVEAANSAGPTRSARQRLP